MAGKDTWLDDKDEKEIAQKKEQKQKDYDFKFEEAKNENHEVYTIYGLKGVGKTALAYSFKGTKAVLSFDKKSVLTKNNLYNKNSDIKVYDAIKYMDENPETFVESCMKTYDYCIFLLENIAKEKVDWIVIDGLEVFTQIGEMVMRGRHGLTVIQGIANRNLWKERRLILRSLHKKAQDASKKGIIYTTYTDKDEVVEDGELVSKRTVPKWIDVIMLQTDIVLHVYSKKKDDSRRFYVDVITSKNDKRVKTGRTIDVTDFKNSIFEGE